MNILKNLIMVLSIYRGFVVCHNILSPTWASHLSTKPRASAGVIFLENSTTSCSADSMAVITVSPLKESWDMPSKHFLRCGCTLSGSFVSERISRSSSLERKKNLKYRSYYNGVCNENNSSLLHKYHRLLERVLLKLWYKDFIVLWPYLGKNSRFFSR